MRWRVSLGAIESCHNSIDRGLNVMGKFLIHKLSGAPATTGWRIGRGENACNLNLQ